MCHQGSSPVGTAQCLHGPERREGKWGVNSEERRWREEKHHKKGEGGCTYNKREGQREGERKEGGGEWREGKVMRGRER